MVYATTNSHPRSNLRCKNNFIDINTAIIWLFKKTLLHLKFCKCFNLSIKYSITLNWYYTFCLHKRHSLARHSSNILNISHPSFLQHIKCPPNRELFAHILKIQEEDLALSYSLGRTILFCKKTVSAYFINNQILSFVRTANSSNCKRLS